MKLFEGVRFLTWQKNQKDSQINIRRNLDVSKSLVRGTFRYSMKIIYSTSTYFTLPDINQLIPELNINIHSLSFDL